MWPLFEMRTVFMLVDIPARLVRTLLGPEKIIGASCKKPDKHIKHGSMVLITSAVVVYIPLIQRQRITLGLDGLMEVCKASKLPVLI
ncbi:thiamine biosynthetic enzyme, putative [Medicago truncatula]|uniref:Thiamine biosynthetic enzyme, putative n=1 Tax=Medicago truncatula TaxID=3880 RepID=A0A072VE52_MEDTR|nr:thiamine biosynthetic enzyme, putative [Medicago truncatula]